MDKCREEMPAYIQVMPDHKVACWLVEEEYGKAA
jgi:hypothetical protein